MFRKQRHPVDETTRKDDGKARRRDPDASGKPQKKPRRKSPPLWQPKSEPRDVNLEVTPDDLDRSAKSRPLPAHRAPSAVPRSEPSDLPGLGAE